MPVPAGSRFKRLHKVGIDKMRPVHTDECRGQHLTKLGETCRVQHFAPAIENNLRIAASAATLRYLIASDALNCAGALHVDHGFFVALFRLLQSELKLVGARPFGLPLPRLAR